MQFKGFKPEAMKKIQGSLGFQGYAEDFDKYLEDNPDKKATMDNYKQKAVEMMNGGMTPQPMADMTLQYFSPKHSTIVDMIMIQLISVMWLCLKMKTAMGNR